MVLWHEDAYTRNDESGRPITFDQYKERQSHLGRWPWMSRSDLQLYAVTGIGFFLDSYDLFIVNLVSPIWAFEYWGGLDGRKPHYPPLLRGLVNSSANIGNIVGQLSFGYLGDIFGRRFVYGNELIIGMIGTILTISLPNSIPHARLKAAWIFVFRFIMGIGIGGDYPISASIMAERTNLKRRGQLLGWIFSNQGWGNLVGCIITVVILAAFSHALQDEGKYGQVDAVWRIQIGLALIPAIATLYPRLRMPEGRKYIESRRLNKPRRPPSVNSRNTLNSARKRHQKADSMALIPSDGAGLQEELDAAGVEFESERHQRASFNVFMIYFSEWRHFKTLLGTMATWFLLDVAFYGVNLNQSVILQEIGFSTGDSEFDLLKRNALGNLIIAVAGYVPGYFVTILLVETLGRRWIQIQGFLVVALMFTIIAGGYHSIGTVGKFVCLAFAQFFFNFGPNATTFIIPAECFPTRVRAFGHGVSAAAGKLGAILSALLFNYLADPAQIGLRSVLWIYVGACLIGAAVTWWAIPETRWVDADVRDYEEWLRGRVEVGGSRVEGSRRWGR